MSIRIFWKLAQISENICIIASRKASVSRNYYKADAKKWGYIEPERWNRFYRWLNVSSLMPGTLPENKGFTNDFLN
mgnify:CR=1 FL=1